ncbi:MAG TPA: HEAT repeat domain-containing protein [Anaerolineales bacterium]|nr:HEAT repeat domain-containing protein [Anaerolineales bacterium]
MANTILEIMSSTSKHKEQVTALTEMAIKDKKVLAQLFDVLKAGTDVEKGTAAEVMKFVSKECPDKMIPYIDVLIEHIDYKAPRVRWGCPESLGNIASQYPDKVEKAIPKLLGNLKDKSTVVRWCAAYALAEIAKHNRKKQEELVTIFNKLIKTEPNNGVRNVYIKALKEIDKQ